MFAAIAYYSDSPAYLYTRDEVAKLTGYSYATIVRYAESGLLKETRIAPATRGAVRTQPRYTRAAIEALVAGYLRAPRRSKITHR